MMATASGDIGFRTSVNDALTATIYGSVVS